MKFNISTAPHVRTREGTQSLMLDVIIALLPTTAIGIYFFGTRAALVIAISVLSSVLTEFIYQKITKQVVRVKDLSAVVTGLLLGLNFPVSVPLWIPIIGSVVAIVLVKQIFGGIGDNFLNPALTARAILLISWPLHMTNFTLPTYFSGIDAVSSATPLAGYNASTLDLFLGVIPGTIGEVCKAAIILGFLYMLVRKTISWRIPVVFCASFALFMWIFGNDPVFELLSGSVLFGSVFMATDYATSPMSVRGQFIYAIGCGLLLGVLRQFGASKEGVTYSILIMNIVTPLIDKYIKPKLYGQLKEAKADVKTS